MGELMHIGKRSERVDQAGEFVSQKSGMLPIPVRHHLLRDALVQAALDPVDAIVLDRDDGRYQLEISEARPRQSIARTLIVAQVLLDLGLRPYVRTKADILREPHCTHARFGRTPSTRSRRPAPTGTRHTDGRRSDAARRALKPPAGRSRSGSARDGPGLPELDRTGFDFGTARTCNHGEVARMKLRRSELDQRARISGAF
jgi:hypothetical protein